jgi:hypothetical protein
MRSIMVVFSDDIVAPLVNLRRCLLRYCVDPKQNGLWFYVVAMRLHVAFKNQAVALLRMSARGQSAGPTELAITKPTLREACFLV